MTTKMTQALRKSERAPKPRDYSDHMTCSRNPGTSLQFKALSPLPSLQERQTLRKKTNCDKHSTQNEKISPGDKNRDFKLTPNHTSTPDHRKADDIQSHKMDIMADSIFISASLMQDDDQTQKKQKRSNSVSDLTILNEKSLTDMLADESQLTLNSTTHGFKTLVSDSVIDNLPLTAPEQRITRLNKLLLTTERDLQDTKSHHQALLREAKATRAQLTIEEAAHVEAKAKLHHLQEQVTALREEVKVRPAQEVRSTPEVQSKPEVLYFRGWKHVLSAQHPCPVTYKGYTFKSKEHAYCNEKLICHDKFEEAEKVKKKRHAGIAKISTHKIIPAPSEEWEGKKGSVMLDIAIQRAQQSATYREALLATTGKRLVHNMETDSCWGFGPDGKGKNLMGTTSEEVRELVIKGNITVEPADSKKQEQKQQQQHQEDIKSADAVIIGDSMLSRLDNYLSDMEIELNVLRGATTKELRTKLGGILKDKRPQFVVIHCGTNDLENEAMDNIKTNYNTIISDVLFYTQGTKIILSGIIHRLDKPHLNDRINTVNSFLTSIQTETVLFADHNSTIRNLHGVLKRGGLHIKPSGTKIVSSNIALLMHSE